MIYPKTWKSKILELVNLNDLYHLPSVVDQLSTYNLLLVWAVYDAFGSKGDETIRFFRTPKINYSLKPKVMKLVEGNLEEIWLMFCDEQGELPSLRLSDMEKSWITLADC